MEDLMNITVMHSADNAFEGWPQEDLDNTDIEASVSKLNRSIHKEVKTLYPEATVSVDSGDYQDTRVQVEGHDNPEMVEEYVRDAVGRVWGAMDWVVSK
jgi:hypothetical protein